MNHKDSSSNFHSFGVPRSPIACSPNKNLTGSIRIAKDIIADLYNTIQRWNDLHVKGAQYVKMIAVEKSTNLKNYSSLLEEHTNNLYAVVQDLKRIAEHFRIFSKQIKALKKVDGKSEKLFMSLNIEAVVELVESIVNAYLDEFKVKENIVLENIAHSRKKEEVMFFAALWTLQPHITSDINKKLAMLLVDSGHEKVN